MEKYVYIFILTLIPGILSDFRDDKCVGTGWSCLDCYTRKLCLFGSLTGTSSCLNDLTGFKTAYCDRKKNECVSLEPEGCKSLSPFKCIREDLFPNVENCEKYFTCKDDEEKPGNCSSLHYFKSTWAKCVFKVSTNDCEQVICSNPVGVYLYPYDPSLYYECKKGVPALIGCPESTQIYDLPTKTCNSICNEKTVGLIPNTRNCSSYYKCEELDSKFNLVKYNCNANEGFNFITKKCEKNYNRLCNELQMFESDIELVLNRIPLGMQIWNIIRSLLNIFRLNPLTLIISFGIKSETYSAAIVVLNYVIQNKGIPPAIISNLIDQILGLLPQEIQDMINNIIKFIPWPFNTNVRKRDLSSNEQMSIEIFLYRALAKLPIDFENIAYSLQHETLNELVQDVSNYFIAVFKIPKENLELMQVAIRNSLPSVINSINDNVGIKVAEDGYNGVKINIHNLQYLVQEFVESVSDEIKYRSTVLGDLIKIVFERYQEDLITKARYFFDDIKI